MSTPRRLVLLLLALLIGDAAGMEWPTLTTGKELPECKTVLGLAQSAFRSTAFNLWEPQTLPKDFDSSLVVGPEGIDLSGGDALDVDLSLFTKVPLPGYAARSVYWQTEASQGNRLAIQEMPYGWRGDAYTVRLIPATMTTSDYFSAVDRPGGGGLTTLIDGAWRAPLVFQRKDTGDLWLVYVGEPYVFSPNWLVYLPIAGQLQQKCEIQFRPSSNRATFLLPGPVQRLAELLDQSIGRGENEGTLQPTARVRIGVNQAWANVALRPWAMGVPYNSREEVDAGLSAWAENGKAYRVAYAKIRAQYQTAETALANYYVKRLDMPRVESQSTAKSVLDIALRMHYVFPKAR